MTQPCHQGKEGLGDKANNNISVLHSQLARCLVLHLVCCFLHYHLCVSSQQSEWWLDWVRDFSSSVDMQFGMEDELVTV